MMMMMMIQERIELLMLSSYPIIYSHRYYQIHRKEIMNRIGEIFSLSYQKKLLYKIHFIIKRFAYFIRFQFFFKIFPRFFIHIVY